MVIAGWVAAVVERFSLFLTTIVLIDAYAIPGSALSSWQPSPTSS
jgi:hypothetical protein